MYMETKEMVWKENHGIQNMGIKNSQGNIIGDQTGALTIYKNYIREPYNQPNQPKNLEFQPQKEVDADQKGHLLFCKVKWKKGIREIRDKKAAGNYNIPLRYTQSVVRNGLRIITQPINKLHETGQWPKQSTELQ